MSYFYGGYLTVQTKCDFFLMGPVSTVLGVSSSFLSVTLLAIIIFFYLESVPQNRFDMSSSVVFFSRVPTQRKYFSESVLQYKLNVRSSEVCATVQTSCLI